MPLWESLKKIYNRYDRHISSTALVGGFVFDIFTLTRVDQFLENFWIAAHLLVAGMGIIALNLYEVRKNSSSVPRLSDELLPEKNEKPNAPKLDPTYVVLIIAIQAAFGGLMSTFLVFYFRSATLTAAWPFLLILIVAFVCNELLKHRYSRLSFQISYLFLSIFSFFIYFLPVMLHQISDKIFILSGILSLIAIALFLAILFFVTREKFYRSKYLVTAGIGGIYIVFNILYFTDIIPPIPLSLKDAGAYHSLTRNADGNYVVQYENEGWKSYFTQYDAFHYVAGDTVYAYSSVFSPTDININIVHQWQFYDATAKVWVNADRVVLPVVGGRDGGFRTYSLKSDLTPGLWRVNIETEQRQLIGRIGFDIIPVSSEPALMTAVNQ